MRDRDAFEVWGDPISHSRSPELHAAAFAAQGLGWSYGRRRVSATTFDTELAAAEARLRGLSLTFPLKALAYATAVERDRHAALSGAVNTLLRTEQGAQGFNTDVGGLARDLREHGFEGVERVRIVGAGATATSALLAAEALGAQQVQVVARRPDAAARLERLGESLRVRVTVSPFDAVPAADTWPLTIATLPTDASVPDPVADALAAGGTLYDVVYGQWPTALAAAWQHAGLPTIDGRGMLLQQALLQQRVFVSGAVDEALPDEPRVLAAMRAALAAAE